MKDDIPEPAKESGQQSNKLSDREASKTSANEDPAKVLHDYIKEQRQQVLTGKYPEDEESEE